MNHFDQKRKKKNAHVGNFMLFEKEKKQKVSKAIVVLNLMSLSKRPEIKFIPFSLLMLLLVLQHLESK